MCSKGSFKLVIFLSFFSFEAPSDVETSLTDVGENNSISKSFDQSSYNHPEEIYDNYRNDSIAVATYTMNTMLAFLLRNSNFNSFVQMYYVNQRFSK